MATASPPFISTLSFTHSSFKTSSSSSFSPKLLRPLLSFSVKASRKQVEIVFDPDERLNKIGDDVDKEAPLSRLKLFSPCKINVFLRITGKREDGFHDLASLFHVISLGDTIKFSLSPSKSKDRLSTNVQGVPVDGRNLIIKALNLYRKKTGSNRFFWIHLDKKVPTGAGLGGGSSNAATALWAANELNGGLVTENELQDWSSEIGSDIPFFFSHGAAYCTGRGEIVQDLPPPFPLDLPMVLIKPREACSTAEVYKRLRLDQTSNINPLTLLENVTSNGVSQSICVNDLGTIYMHMSHLPSFAKKIATSLKFKIQSDTWTMNYIYAFDFSRTASVFSSSISKTLEATDNSIWTWGIRCCVYVWEWKHYYRYWFTRSSSIYI